MPRVMLIDDGQGRVAGLAEKLADGPGDGSLQVITMRIDRDTLERIKRQRPDAVVMASGDSGPEGDTFSRLRRWDAGLPVILVGEADSGTDATIEAIKRGAMDYLAWPVDAETLRRRVESAVARSQLGAELNDSAADFAAVGGELDQIIGRSESMQQVYKMIGRVAQENVTVLIVGESGTGKELVARSIHQHSARADQPFLAINCAALPEPLLESELFGHEQGAFTGADRARLGKFQQADGGTLLLDELGDMSPLIQAKFLRVLQDGCFERVGGNETLRADVRVIAATNQDLQAKIEAGQFRSDLFYRLNSFTVPLPPLRERPEDLPGLVDHFLRLANRRVNNRALSVSDQAMRLLQDYPWPGNVRELQSAITYAVVHAVAEIITPECLPDTCRIGTSKQQVASGEQDSVQSSRTPPSDSISSNGDSEIADPLTPGSNGDEQAHRPTEGELAAVAEHVRRRLAAGDSNFFHGLIREVERIAVTETLRHVGGNQVQASRRLGMSRNTLRARLPDRAATT